jgi:ABC-2 type transport system ATP-binding protein
MLVARNLTKRFAEVLALDNLDLSVSAGEIVCLLGANGAGKTTAVNLLLGFLESDAGEALVNGHNVSKSPEAARKCLAYIPEQVSLFPLLTGIENLTYFASLSGRELTTPDASQLLNEVGLDTESHARRAATYSKGMRQKVGVAIALAKKAKALVLDEPLSGLDPVAARELGQRMAAFRADGGAVLMVTHDIFRAREIADRIGIMRSGKLLEMIDAASVSAEELDRRYAAHIAA